MSNTTNALLEKLGGFHIESRGEREVKVRKGTYNNDRIHVTAVQ
jgi:hypothetical protein